MMLSSPGEAGGGNRGVSLYHLRGDSDGGDRGVRSWETDGGLGESEQHGCCFALTLQGLDEAEQAGLSVPLPGRACRWKAHGLGWLLGQADNTSGIRSARAAPLQAVTYPIASRKALGYLRGKLVLEVLLPSVGFQVIAAGWEQSSLLRSNAINPIHVQHPHALLLHPRRTWLPLCCPTTANVPAERVFLAEKLLSSLWKQ